MKEKSLRRKSHQHYDEQFKLLMLRDYYESGMSQRAFCRSHGVDMACFIRWKRKYEEESIPLPADLTELESKVYKMARKKKMEREASQVKSQEEQLREEIERLRKALEYSELRNEALEVLLQIGKEKYGLDLLKKAGAKQ